MKRVDFIKACCISPIAFWGFRSKKYRATGTRGAEDILPLETYNGSKFERVMEIIEDDKELQDKLLAHLILEEYEKRYGRKPNGKLVKHSNFNTVPYLRSDEWINCYRHSGDDTWETVYVFIGGGGVIPDMILDIL